MNKNTNPRETALMIISIFLGLIGIAGLIVTLSKGIAGFYDLNNIIIFLASALFVAISISLLKEILD